VREGNREMKGGVTQCTRYSRKHETQTSGNVTASTMTNGRMRGLEMERIATAANAGFHRAPDVSDS
jgi:hypothetical protein